MASIYIISDKGKLGKKDETFVFSQPDGSATILFPFKTEILFLVGNVSISGDALRMLSKYKIPVVFLSSNGKFNSKLVYSDSKNVFLRQKQYLTLSDPEKSCAIARSIVEGKLKNQISKNFPDFTALMREHHLVLERNAKKVALLTLDANAALGRRRLGEVTVINFHKLPSVEELRIELSGV